jgi:diguanylate cyclase (GGDEF)-like protein/PAS domain S-box-containing protein
LRLAASVFETTHDGIMITDEEGTILSVNPAFSQITGYSAQEAIGETPRLLKSEHHDQAFYDALWSSLISKGYWQGEVWNRRKNGELYIQWQTISMLPDAEGRPSRYVAVFSDVTELRRKDERIRQQAYHDALTGLPNRFLLLDRLEHGIDVARRAMSGLAVMFLDLDRFKVVNDSLGHEAGDLLLQAVAGRLELCLRKSDTIARLGGDEFVIVLSDFESTAEIALLSDRIVASLAAPFDLNGHPAHIGASIGIAVYPQDGSEAGTLMKNADAAMYQAKGAGRNTFRFFDPAINSKALERLDMEADLRRAVELGQFEMHYQPKVDLRQRKVRGLEALLRWRHPERGLVQPNDFIPMAEDTGLIVPLGAWALEESCRQAKIWLDEGIAIGRMAVNLSARQFQDLQLFERVSNILEKTGLAAHHLEIELTESTVMANPRQAIDVLERLHKLGIQIAVDDFGTGYSSLNYLKKLPLDILKIDRAFVSDLGRNEEDGAIIQAIVTLGMNLDLVTVAEGVETVHEAQMLERLGCTQAQGFLFTRPLPAKEAAAWLKDFTRN